MADQPVRFTPLGNLDKDSEYKLIGKGNYTDALDVIKQDDEGQVSGTIQPTKRNKHAFSLGSVQAQNKRYRVTVSGDATKNHALNFLSTKRDYRITTGTGPNGEVEFNGTISSLQSAFNASNLPGAFQVSVSGNTMEFELAPYPYYNWYLESVGDDDVEVVCIQEAIPTDLAGPLKDIGSYDLLGDLFVFSTTQDNEPTELEAEIIDVGPIGPNPTPPPNNLLVGPLTSLTFNAPHGLQEGQWIRIVDSNAPWLNGTFVVNDVTSTIGVEIVTDTAWGATHPTFIVGQEKVFIHPTGIGEIGVAQKNNSTESWTYTRLLRSWELDFVSIHKIDCHSHQDSLGTNIYYTDDYNPPRKFLFVGDYGVDFALNVFSNPNIYYYDFIFSESSLINGFSKIKIELEGQDNVGGNLYSGNKYYFVRVTNFSYDDGFWSSSSNPVEVYKNPSGSGDGSTGNSSLITDKVNNLKISGLNPLRDKEISVAVLEEIDGVLSATLFLKTEVDSSEITIKHTGNERDLETIDVGSLVHISQSYFPIQAKNISSVDSRNVLSNVVTLEKIDLSAWTTTFKHSITKDYITEFTRNQFGEYQDVNNVFNERGFMLNETYRIGCRAYIKGLGITDVFWVDDIRVDPNSINESNPTDNRRNQSDLDNYDLIEVTPDFEDYFNNTMIPRLYNGNVTNSNPDGTTFANQNDPDPSFQTQCGVKYFDGWNAVSNGEFYRESAVNPDFTSRTSISRIIVPKIQIEDIDYSFNIEGLGLASDHVEALEFFIADVPKSVKASGVSIFSVEEESNQSPENGTIGGVILNDRIDTGTEGISYGTQPKNESSRYIFEYPFSCGSSKVEPDDQYVGRGDYGNVMVNYPIRRHSKNTRDGSSPRWEYKPRTDIVSFYSGDTVFSEAEPGAKELIVFGASELFKNIRFTPSPFNDGIFPNSDNVSGFWYNTSASYYAKFQQRGTSDTFKKYKIKEINNIIPEEIPQPPDLNLTDIDNGFAFSSDGLNQANAQTADDLGATYFSDFRFSKVIPLTIPNVENAPADPDDNQPAGKEQNGLSSFQKGPVIYLEEEIDFNEPSLCPSYNNNIEILRYSNRGVVSSQLYADETSNFPPKSDTKYMSLGSVLFSSETNYTTGQHKLKCGDTHSQNTIIKHQYDGINASQINTTIDSGFGPRKSYNQFKSMFGSVMSVVCQNRVNANMYTVPTEISENPPEFSFQDSFYRPYYPKLSLENYALSYGFESPVEYSTSYNSFLNIKLAPYNIRQGNFGAKFDFPTRILWSELKNQEGINDEYRLFLPLNRKDLDRTFGEINHHEDINGELFTLQPRKYQLQYFNTRGTLQGSNSGVEVLIGDGSVLSRDGQTLSSYGTNHKWSVVKGSSPGGKDVIYWFNQEKGLFMRFGADGTVVLSERSGLRSFSANNTKWTENQYTPALNYGIRSVWDDRFKEAIWTFIGVRDSKGEWGTIPSNELYSEGDTVTGSTFGNYPFDGVPDVYISLSNHFPIPQSEPGVGSDWETYWRLADKDDPEYYTVFTLAFNELSNGFSTFYSHLPKTYLKWKNKFLSSHPTERSEIYEHRYGYDKWYEYEGVWKESEPFLEGVVNPFPDQSKKFVAIQALSDNVPDRIELITKDHESFLVSTDFDPEDDTWRTPIKNDILTSQTSDPNDDTESLVGAYMRVKFKFFNGAYNKLNNLVVKVRQRLRRTQS